MLFFRFKIGLSILHTLAITKFLAQTILSICVDVFFKLPTSYIVPSQNFMSTPFLKLNLHFLKFGLKEFNFEFKRSSD